MPGNRNIGLWNAPIFFSTLTITLTLTGCVSWWKINRLKAGGAVIAVELGGTRVFPEIATPKEQELLNIVEEMAIAATMPIPAVYILKQEFGLNSFAAGWTVNDAVIGLTQGSLERLTRDELQAIVAHEFGHILNGDMAINIRLTGMLHGILALRLMARISGKYSSIAISSPLFNIVGLSGYISGRLIQSAISKQREFLADASAVQFTRNPESVASALAKIGDFGSYLDSPYIETNYHIFFAPASASMLSEGIFSAHPKFDKRIQSVRGMGKKLGTKIVINGQPVPEFNQIERIDNRNIASESADLGEYGTLAHIYCLLINPERSIEQLDYLVRLEEPATIEQIEQLQSTIETIPPHQRLVTLDRQIGKIRNTIHAPRLVKCAYGMVNILPAENWHTALVYLILHHRLATKIGTPQEIYHSIDDVWAEMMNILGTLARLSSNSPQTIDYNFEVGLMRLPTSHTIGAKLPPELNWREFQTDLSKIAAASAKVKQTLMAACLEILTNQRQFSQLGADLMRSISILLDCPTPPILDRSFSSEKLPPLR